MFECTNPPLRKCRSDEFQCTKTKQCIPLNTLCDIDNNCCDGSDESVEMCQQYTRMDFESNLKDKYWKQLDNEIYDTFDFKIETGPGKTYFDEDSRQSGPPW